MADHVRVWSDELARDPSSLVFLPLAETLRRRGQLELARKVAARGVERHPDNAEAHDQLARILADAGDLAAAYESWRIVLRLSPSHAGAIKGMAFVRFQQGELAEAERLLLQAQQLEGTEAEDLSEAIRTVRNSGPVAPVSVDAIDDARDPRTAFRSELAAGQSAILLDAEGLVLAGAYEKDGHDVAEAVGATLSGVSAEATRASRHLGIGAWRAITFESERAVVSLAPIATDDVGTAGLLLVTAPPSTPLGLLHRLLDRCYSRARDWLGRGGTVS